MLCDGLSVSEPHSADLMYAFLQVCLCSTSGNLLCNILHARQACPTRVGCCVAKAWWLQHLGCLGWVCTCVCDSLQPGRITTLLLSLALFTMHSTC